MSQPPRVQFNFTEDEIADSAPSQKIDDIIEDVKEDLLPDTVLEDVKEPSQQVDALSAPSIDREQIVQEEIFVVKEPRNAPKEKPVKKKRQLSEEHKAKLALAREKALATRRAKAEEKKKMKAIENETKELKKKKATKELESLKEEVNNDKPVPTSKTPSAVPQQFTLKDLEQAQLAAIMSYEQVRKARKEEKKKQKMIEEQQQKLKSQINNFTKPQGYGARDANGRLINKWHNCY